MQKKIYIQLHPGYFSFEHFESDHDCQWRFVLSSSYFPRDDQNFPFFPTEEFFSILNVNSVCRFGPVITNEIRAQKCYKSI